MTEQEVYNKIEMLDGKNFQTWKFNMKLILMERGLWGFIAEPSTEIPPPATDKAACVKHKSRSEKAYSIIALSVEKKAQIHIVGTTDPKEAWDKLAKQFSFISVTQIVRLTRRFYAAQMAEGDDLQEHLMSMSNLAQQLRELGEEISPSRFAIAILGSLPPSYDNFITSLNAQSKENFDWDTVNGALLEEEAKRTERFQVKDEDALFTRNGDKYVGNRGTRRSNAPAQDGFIPSQQDFTCYRCGKPGHVARNCRSNAINSRFGNGRWENSFQNMNINQGFDFANSANYHEYALSMGDSMKIHHCRDYMNGSCSRGRKCKFRHISRNELDCGETQQTGRLYDEGGVNQNGVAVQPKVPVTVVARQFDDDVMNKPSRMDSAYSDNSNRNEMQRLREKNEQLKRENTKLQVEVTELRGINVKLYERLLKEKNDAKNDDSDEDNDQGDDQYPL